MSASGITTSQVARQEIYTEVHSTKAERNFKNKTAYLDKTSEKNTDLLGKAQIGGMAVGGVVGGLCGIPGGPAGVGIGSGVGVGVGFLVATAACCTKILIDVNKHLKLQTSKAYLKELNEYLNSDDKYKDLLKDKTSIEYNVMASHLLKRDIPVLSENEENKEMVKELNNLKESIDDKLFKSYKKEQKKIENAKKSNDITNGEYIDKINDLNAKYYPRDL